MRRLNKHFRRKNPGTKESRARGEKKRVHDDLLELLSKPRKNPNGRKSGQLVDAYNLLGRLNQLIDRGETEYIPLRDTVAANIEGNLGDRALDYSLEEALADLGRAEVRVIRQMIDDLGGEASPEEGREIRRAAKLHPDVQRALRRVEAAEKQAEVFQQSLRRRQIDLLPDIDFIVGPERMEVIRAQDKGARAASAAEEVSYRPADRKLWKRVESALEKKYPEKYVPPKMKSQQRKELAALIKMSHASTSEGEKSSIRRKLQTALTNRWKTKMILAYEKAGGKEMSPQEVRIRQAQRMRKLGVPFPVGPGFFGVVKKAGQKFDWFLVDRDGSIYMSSDASSKNSASRDITIAYRIISNLAKLNAAAGWDNLDDNDRRWLEDRKPKLAKRVARVLLQHINESRKVSKTTATWIVSAADLGKVTQEERKEDVKQSCKNMTLGEERIFPGEKRAYFIHVKKGAGGRLSYFVETKEGKRSETRRTSDCDEVMRRGHMIGGAMTGAMEVTRAISNPAKIKRMGSSARRYFAKKNPSIERSPAEEGDIRELTGMAGIPDDPKDAYRYGFYFGIIKGIDTCGVQNYFKRKRIRDEFKTRILEAALETSARASGTKAGRVILKRGDRKKKSAAEEFVDVDFDF